MISPSHIPFIYDQPVYVIQDKEAKRAVNLPTIENGKPLEKKPIVATISNIENKEIQKIAEEPIKVTPLIDESLEIIKEKCLKKIWLWVKPKDEETISAAEYEMITKTLTALGKQLIDVSIFVPHEVAHSYFNKLDLKDIRIIDFGMCLANINSTPLQSNKIEIVRNAKYLYTYQLHTLQQDLTIKKEWWAQMKALLS